MRVQPYVRRRVGALRRLFDRVESLLAALPAAERDALGAEGAAWTDQRVAEVILQAVCVTL